MDEIRIGLRGSKEFVVTEKDLASVTGNIGADVLSTHCVVLLMELASRSAMEGLLQEGKMTVGTQINIRHFGAVPLGARVKAESILTEINGRRLLFDVTAYDDFEKIAEGRNEQLIVPIAGFLRKVRWKKGLRE
ncbi:MAG: thioesterase [Deltaproteobacteria bacterium]|nr:thioesterase [Deltaproteobacteria bacterium]